jgi:hypothetical protein
MDHLYLMDFAREQESLSNPEGESMFELGIGEL